MRFVFKFKLFCLAFSLSVFFVFLTPAVNAGPSDNIRGWAWNNIYGWISFNSDDCSVVGGNYNGSPSGCPTTPYYSYGVKVDNLGNFSGYAWNNAVGWISFNRCGTDGDCSTSDGDTGNPQEPPYDSGTGPIANEADGSVTGWAKALSLGENGWIRFDHAQSDPVTFNETSGDFLGWAYGGDTGMGWISFNCEDYKACNGGANAGEICTVNTGCTSNFCDDACNLSPYRVYKDDGILPPATSGNVSGWAWNNNIGWISFSSNDCDVNGNGVFEGPSEGAPTGCPTGGTVVKYGVNIDLVTGIFSGYAWNDKVGWISFEESGLAFGDGDNTTPDLDFATYCDATSGCDSAGNCTACYNSTDKYIYGWAKVLSMVDDGWIRFDHGQTGYEAYVDLSDGALRGWAYNQGMVETGVGWISLNCIDTTDACANSDYRVIINFGTSMTISEMTAPNWSHDNACDFNTALIARLRWKYEDASFLDATAYRIQVSGGGESFNTGQCLKSNGVSGNCTIDFSGENSSCLESGGYCWYTLNTTVFPQMTYGENYTWELEVWDNQGISSGPVIYNSNTSSDTDGDPDNDSTTFTTYLSKFPNPDDFTWSPSEFSVEQEAYFESGERAKYYNGSSEIPCDEDNCIWSWNDPDSNITFIGEPTASSTILEFNTADTTRVGLTITDQNGYSCSSTTEEAFNIMQKLPSWIETKSP